MKLSIKKIFYLLCTILIVIFIFYNSIQNGDESSKASMSVLTFINNIFTKINLDFQMEGNFVRKLAHFIEFFIFGNFLMLTFISFTNKTFSIIGFAMFFVTFVPVIDEYIQIFSVGRTSSVKDILLDFFSGLAGIILVCVYSNLKSKINNRYKYK